jgi:hypothetical protein
MFVTRGMQWHPSESLGRNNNTELRPVARTASTACVPVAAPIASRTGDEPVDGGIDVPVGRK